MRNITNIDILDYGRFISAFAVMMFHYVVNGPRAGKITSFDLSDDPVSSVASFGYIGVDFFFMVSGFVIALSAAQATPRQFFRSRFLRLWPTFMVCMTVTALVRLASGRVDMEVSVAQYVANWTMAAPYIGYSNMDGVYWALVYELIFYALMLAILVLGWAARLEAICRVWLVAILALELTDIRIPGFTGYFALFCAGSMFSFVVRSGWTFARTVFLLFATVYCALEAMGRVSRTVIDDGSAVTVAVITTAFFGLFALIVSSKLGTMKLPYARMLGLMTYPLYLLHAYIGYVVLSLFADEQSKWVAIILTSALMLVASFVVVRWFEDPMKPIFDRVWPRYHLPGGQNGTHVGGPSDQVELASDWSRHRVNE